MRDGRHASGRGSFEADKVSLASGIIVIQSALTKRKKSNREKV